MELKIFSRKTAEEIISEGVKNSAAVISFFTPERNSSPAWQTVCERLFCVGVPDIDIEILADYGYSYESYLSDAHELAEFIYDALNAGCEIICQCDYGQSRSAACAAAILQHFEGRGIDIFADYRYYPNQLVYHKVFDALEKYKSGQTLAHRKNM